MLRRASRGDANTAVVREVFEAWNRGDDDAVARVCSGTVHHSRFRQHDSRAVGAANDPVRDACPDFRLEIEELLSAGDKVVARLTARGTHTRPFLGRPPTGREIAFELIEILRVSNAKIVERWGVTDELFALQQFGLGVQPSVNGADPAAPPVPAARARERLGARR